MISTGIAILIGILSAAIGIGIYIVAANTITKNTVKARRQAAIKEAEAEGEIIKK